MVQQAQSLDPEMIQVHACTGALATLERDWDIAEAAFQEAIRLGPHTATYRQYSLLLAVQERFDESWGYLQKALEMDVFSHRQQTACARFLYISRRYSEIGQFLKESWFCGPIPAEARLYAALSYLALGKTEPALQIAHAVRGQAGIQRTIAALLAEVLAQCGETAAAQELVRSLDLLSPGNGLSRFRQALLAAALGDLSAAMTFLASAHAQQEPELIWLQTEPRLDSLRNQSQFIEMLDGTAPFSRRPASPHNPNSQ